MSESLNVRDTVNRILNAHRRGLRDRLQTVGLLETFVQRLSPQDRRDVCEYLGYVLRAEPLDSQSVRGVGVNMVSLALLALGRFGPTDHLAPFVFSRIRLDNPREMETWAREICPNLQYCLYQNRDRFADQSLAQIKSLCSTHRLADVPLPLPLVEALADLEIAVEQIEFERFEQSLHQATNRDRPEAQDLEAVLIGLSLDPKIAAAMEESESCLRSGGEFDPKKAADLLRASIDETHRAVVSELGKIRGTLYSGKDKDGDRRSYMRDLGFISSAEERFFSSIYSLISEEASHKLVAPRETVLVLQTTVKNYLLLLLKRLNDWRTPGERTGS